MSTMTQQEQDIRLSLLNSFLTCPHRDTDGIKKIHEELREKDPLFYAHLASWYNTGNGDIRDHKEMFSSMLITDPFVENREVGLAMFRQFPVYLKRRVLGSIKGKEISVRHKTGKKKRIGKKTVEDVRIEKKTVGLFKNTPTSFKKEVETFLRHLEKDNEKFDGIVVRSAKDLKSLYASLRIKPSKRANDILFKKKRPKTGKLSVFEKIVGAKSPEEQAKLIVENKVPYTVAVGLVENVTPSILVALINSMSPMELINNIASLEEKGATDNPDIKKLIEKKLKKAETSKSVSALKSKEAKKTGRVKNEEISAQLDKIADKQIQSKGTIRIPTAIFVDRSGSMSQAIEVGKHCAALVSGATTADLYVLAFDTLPMEVIARGRTLTDWENAFRPVRPGGSTSMGSALEFLRRSQKYVEQIVVITDEGENAHPLFHNVYQKYAEEMKVRPNVVVIRVGGAYESTFSHNLTRHGIEFDVYSPADNDYYGLPGLVQLLSKKSKLDLLMEIMSTSLLSRKPLT